MNFSILKPFCFSTITVSSLSNKLLPLLKNLMDFCLKTEKSSLNLPIINLLHSPNFFY